MSDTISPTTDNSTTLLNYFNSTSRVPLKWSFPRLTSFDPVSKDLLITASAVEKTVGQTWSTPIIGQVESEEGPFVALVGSVLTTLM